MSICFGALFLIVSGIIVMISMLRWFEQTRDAVDSRNWSRLTLLVVAPPAVWMFPARVSAGRPIPIAKYEPVRGFGGLPKGGIVDPGAVTAEQSIAAPARPEGGAAKQHATEGPPPGTPPEFIGLPKIPPKKAPRAVDPEKLAKLRQKMKEQGMLPDE
ncbi:MAG: hypothetical protein H7Z14_16735 [Anaerolineae bacterium]|nr:hypothetical protein [Phycisphaerae bacterium]